MRLIVDSADRFVSLGGDALAAGDGQRARDTKLTAADVAAADAALAALAALGGPGEVWHDAQADQFRVRARAATADETTRALVLQAAGSAVGVNITALTAVQVRALLAVLLYKAGAIDSAGVVLPLAGWAQR